MPLSNAVLLYWHRSDLKLNHASILDSLPLAIHASIHPSIHPSACLPQKRYKLSTRLDDANGMTDVTKLAMTLIYNQHSLGASKCNLYNTKYPGPLYQPAYTLQKPDVEIHILLYHFVYIFISKTNAAVLLTSTT